MKKRIVNLIVLLLSFVSINLYAQTLSSTAPNGTFTSEDIDYWIGEGENEIGIIFVYNNESLSPDYFVLGYRWNGNNITLEDALTEIAFADSRFDMSASGGFLDDYGFDYDEDGAYEYSAYTNDSYGYFNLRDNCTSTPTGMSSYYLTGNSWISIEYKTNEDSWEDCFAQTGTYTAIPAPNDEPMPCLLPSNLHVDFVTENSAIIYLGTLPANYTLYLKAQGETSYTSYSITNEVTYTMENLLSGTDYECYIIKDCGEGSLSEESEHLTFTTLTSQANDCDIVSLPYTEDFDSYGTTGGGVYPYPSCWTKITTGNIPNINTTKHSGVGGLYLQAAPNTQVVAVMPKIADNINLNTLSLTFWGKRGSAGNRITVGVMTDKDDATTFDTLFAVSPSSNAWAEYTLDFSQYTGSAKYIAFICNGNRYYIDDVVLDGNSSTVEPTNPSITDENIVAWAKGVEVVRANTVTTGNYYDAIGQANTTDYVSIQGGLAVATFDRPINNAEGDDFVVFGNNTNNGQAYVEVSSNGTDFFRFDSKTSILATGLGTAYDLDNLSDNANLDKNNIRLVRLVDDSTAGFLLAGVGVYNGGEQYQIADFENMLSTPNTYEIVTSSTPGATLIGTDDYGMNMYSKDYANGGLVFNGLGLYGGSFSIGWGPSNLTTNSGYYASSASSALEGAGNGYLQGYFSDFAGTTEHLTVVRDNNTTFSPKGTYVCQSAASFSDAQTLATNDNNPGWMKIVATGYNADGSIAGSSFVYLVNNATNGVGNVKEWRWLDMSSFGEVAKVKFTMESNYANNYGLLISAYFCVDNFVYMEGSTIEEPEPECPVVTNLQVMESGTEENQASVMWNSDNPEFYVYYKEQSATDFDSVLVSGNLFYTIEGLTANTTYECYVRTKCSETNLSNASAIITFTTLASSLPDAPSMTDENIVAWAKGVEIKRAFNATAGNYYDAIGQANTTDYVAILNGYAKASFDRPITNQEGADFVVFAHNDNENGRAFVEVSSNGSDFFRFAEKTSVQTLGYGTAYDLDDLDDNANLDKNNIRLVRLVDDNIGVFNLAGIGIYHGGEQYLIADFEEGTFLTAANTYEIVALDNYTRTEEDEDTEMTYYYKDHVSAGLNFPGIGYDLSGWFMTAGFGASNGTSSAISGNGGEYVDANYYVSSAMAGVEGAGYTYMQSYDAGAFGPQQQNEIKTTNNTTFFPQGVYVSHSNASYTYTGQTNDYEPGYHKVIATGYDAQGTVLGSVYVYLTENGNAYKDWKWLDLSSLGEVAKVKFALESNYANSYGLLIPSYFCVDNFVYRAGNEIEEPCTPTASTIDVSLCEGDSYNFDSEHSYSEEGTYEITLTNAAGCDSTITLNIAVMPTYNEEITLEISSSDLPYQFGEQVLTELGTYTETFTSINGCDSVVTLTLVIPNGINEVENNYSVSLYPNPTSESATLSVKGLNEQATIIVTDQQGRVISTSTLTSGQENSVINTDNLASGVYYIRIQTTNSVRTEKLIKK